MTVTTPLPFVLFRLPGENASTIMTGNLKMLHAEQWPEEEGFMFAPFKNSEKHPIIFLQATDVSAITNAYSFLHSGFESYPEHKIKTAVCFQATKKEYLHTLEELILQLRDGVAGKVVISRTTATPRIPDSLLPALYNELCLQHPAAFVYLAYFPSVGTWMGASPETLITSRGEHCSTMSLAGTRTAGAAGNWGNKEMEEQAIVTRFIRERLESLQVQNLEISMPHSLSAGQIEHLCTTFHFDLTHPSELSLLVRKLHPTPAVCGFPPDKAMQMIAQYEKHEREYYTGFLGPVNHGHKTGLFVNLRCMKINSQQMTLYAGGGITGDSVPEKEWEETELKTRTLMVVIEKICNLAL